MSPRSCISFARAQLSLQASHTERTPMRQQTHAASPRERLNKTPPQGTHEKRGWRSTKTLRLSVRVSGKARGSQAHGQRCASGGDLSMKISVGTIREADCELDYRYRNSCRQNPTWPWPMGPSCCNAGNKSRSGRLTPAQAPRRMGAGHSWAFAGHSALGLCRRAGY